MQTRNFIPPEFEKGTPLPPYQAGVAESWPDHARATLNLAVPLVGAQLAQIAIGVTDTVMIGWLGAPELAASVLATQGFFIFFIFGVGFAQAALPLAANAEGRGDVRGVRRSIRMGLWVLTLYSALAMIRSGISSTILLALGQEPAIAALAGNYMRVALWSMSAALLVWACDPILPWSIAPISYSAIIVVGVLCNGLLNYAFIFGHFGAPALGIVGAASRPRAPIWS